MTNPGLKGRATAALARNIISTVHPVTVKMSPPNYRNVAGASLQHCGTCQSFQNGRCMKYAMTTKRGRTCDTWRPDTEALRKEAQATTAKHLKGKHDQAEHSQKRTPVKAQASGDEEETATDTDRVRGGSDRARTPRQATSTRSGQAAAEARRKLSRTRLKEAGSTPTTTWAHGPGGLFSAPGLMNGRTETEDEEHKRKARELLATKAALSGGPLHSTQSDMPTPIKALAALYAKQIPTEDLHKNGIERDTHVTIFYGLNPSPNLEQQVRTVAAATSPFDIQLGQVSLFTENQDFDVVKVEVDSPQLRELNGRLAHIHNGNTRTTYNPHMTIAYVKKGAGAKYVGDNTFNGRRVYVDTLLLSDSDYRKTAVPLGGGVFNVFKDKNGDYRWAAISSNAYRDRDREIVSQKALEADVEHADKTKEYGPLRFWHMPGVDIGTCDFNMMHGRMLIESGSFNSPEIGERVKQFAPNYQLSIGFRHPPDQPDSDGVYHNIRRFERSLVPAGRAANPFTRLQVKETDMSDEKIKALQTLLGQEATNQILANAQGAQKQADDLGVVFKSSDVDWNALAADPAALLDAALKNFETAEAEAVKAEAKGDDMDDDDKEESYKMGDLMKEMQSMSAKMDKFFAARAEKEAAGTDAATAVANNAQSSLAEVEAVQNKSIATLTMQVKQLTDKLETAVKELNEAKAVPAAFDQGYRPSEADTTVKEGEAAVETSTVKNGTVPEGGFGGLLNFMTGNLGQ